jgi:elongation factor G
MANGFEPQKIRNVVVVGHKGSGKTTLVEGMLYVGGAIPEIGGVANKTSILDDEPEEIEREATLQTSLAHTVWKGTKINVIDTPGGGSFFGDTRIALAAADAVIITVSAKDGVQPMTERLNNWAAEMGLPRFLVITKCDLEHVQVDAVVEHAKKRLKIDPARIQVRVGDGPDMKGVIDVLGGRVYAGDPDGPKTAVGSDVPAEHKDAVEEARASVIEEVASKDDELIEITPESIRIRKKSLDPIVRKRAARDKKNAAK